jgi:hypothetical protein
MGEERECQSVLITLVAVFAVDLGWELGADVAVSGSSSAENPERGRRRTRRR